MKLVMKKKTRVIVRFFVAILFTLLLFVGAILLFMHFYPTFGKTPDSKQREVYGQKTKLFDGKQFRNESVQHILGKRSPDRERIRPEKQLPAVSPGKLERLHEDELKFVWFGHSSTLFQMGERNIFLDPVLSERTSPVDFAGPQRFSELAISIDEVPELDVVFISHDHYDHLDYKTIKGIDSRVKRYVVPLGIDVCLKGWGVPEEKIVSLAWWESVELEGISFTLIPSQHFSGRNPLKMNRTLWGGIYFTDSFHSVYYSGDTGYFNGFAEVYERLGAPDVMLADSGQYNAGWAGIHMTPWQAVQAASDAHAKRFVPVHWGAFVLSNHPWDEPPKGAVEEGLKLGVDVATPRLGQLVDVDQLDQQATERWWENYE